MIRYHYGPWDPRYYHVLAYLEGRELVTVHRERKSFIFTLTATGTGIAHELASSDAFRELSNHIRAVKKVLGKKSGDWLKKLIYSLFDEEVARLPLGEAIQP